MKTMDNEITPANTKRYTLDGETDVEKHIARDQRLIAKGIKKVLGEHLYAVILMGGYGRGEGGFCLVDEKPQPYNDYDYFVVVRGMNSKAAKLLSPVLQNLAKTLEKMVGIEVDFAVLRFEALKQSEYSLMNAEMLWGHRVICGDEHVLDVMPDMPFSTLPQGEFTRLMLNRGSLLLMNKLALNGCELIKTASCEKFIKYLFKAVLACGDAVLTAQGMYHPSYPEKIKRLEAINFMGMESLRQNYQHAYEAKFHADYRPHLQADLNSWQNEVVDVWLSCFSMLESTRLNRNIQDWKIYCDPYVDKGQDRRWFRNIAITYRDYGFSQLMTQPVRACRYPRERLIAALPILLQSDKESLLPVTAKALAVTPCQNWRQLSESYLQQWVRYA
jgi:hypothetical protein